MVEQSFIYMTNLLDIQRPERQAACLNSAAKDTQSQKLQRFQKMQYGAIANWQRYGRCIRPRRTNLSAFEKCVAVWVK
ncbi:hypothetical protein AQ730_10775 [Burkholderia pseudomallei]|nr:hypothetical protein AQ730_10775 [Burkholderia pseudomallei]